MVSALLLSAVLVASVSTPIAPAPTNAVVAVEKKKRRPRPRRREDMTPKQAWHNFARGDSGKVKFDKDTRPKPFDKEARSRHERKPRK